MNLSSQFFESEPNGDCMLKSPTVTEIFALKLLVLHSGFGFTIMCKLVKFVRYVVYDIVVIMIMQAPSL